MCLSTKYDSPQPAFAKASTFANTLRRIKRRSGRTQGSQRSTSFYEFFAFYAVTILNPIISPRRSEAVGNPINPVEKNLLCALYDSVRKKLPDGLFPSGRRKTRKLLNHFFDRIDRILKIEISTSNPINPVKKLPQL
jgi:hypothetical protein